jgi:hypothetical protein
MIKRFFMISGLGVLSMSLGCATMMDDSKAKDKKKEGWSWFKKKEYQEPKSMVAIWTEDTLIQPGKPYTRGFGGRIYFYNEKSQAIPVEGELMVYGFEDKSGDLAKGSWPSDPQLASQDTKRFRFTPEQFTQHFSESQLGASYSVWIPWDVVGGPQKKIILCPMFISKAGRMVRGETSKLSLSGPGGPAANLAQQSTPLAPGVPAVATHPSVQLASATVPMADATGLPASTPIPGAIEPGNGGATMRTTTIRMSQPVNYRGNHPAATNVTSPAAPNLATPQQAAQWLQAWQQSQSGLVPQPTNTGAAGAATTTEHWSTNSTIPAHSPGGVTANQQGSNHPWNGLLPTLGHGMPTTGWVSPGSFPPAATLGSVGSLPHQSPAPTSTAAR